MLAASRAAGLTRGGLSGELLDQQVEAGLLMAGAEPVAARQGGQAVERAPGDLAQGLHIAVSGQWCERGAQFSKCGTRRGGRAGDGERQVNGHHEHRVVDSGPGLSEAQVGSREAAQRRCGGTGGGTCAVQLGSQLAETLQGNGPHDVRLVFEVAVEDRLAVLDPLGQAAHRHTLPAFCFGQFAGCCDDQLPAAGPVAVTPLA